VSNSEGHANPLTPEAQQHYSAGNEIKRLLDGSGRIERERTQILLQRYLPPAPAVILDVGGGAGIYAFWLARQDYTVHLIDAMPLHIEQTRQIQQSEPDAPLASIVVGDARELEFPNESVDAVLLLGPLYHLIERSDRIQALREARRVLKPGGVVFAVGISRFASLLDGMANGLLADPVFQALVQQDLTDGQHRNPSNHPGYFTTTFFHHPDELKAEVEEVGFQLEKILGIEGPAWLMPYVKQHWEDEPQHAQFLDLLQRAEEDPALLGVSAHIMVVGQVVPDGSKW
jgi:ubiquinone/menaquinone biosynthesis C-methylase UbiE